MERGRWDQISHLKSGKLKRQNMSFKESIPATSSQQTRKQFAYHGHVVWDPRSLIFLEACNCITGSCYTGLWETANNTAACLPCREILRKPPSDQPFIWISLHICYVLHYAALMLYGMIIWFITVFFWILWTVSIVLRPITVSRIFSYPYTSISLNRIFF